MATEPSTSYKLRVVIQNTTNKVSYYYSSDDIIVDKNTGENLTHRLSNLEIVRKNLNTVADAVKVTIGELKDIPVVSPSEINGNILINNKETTIYTPDRSIVRYGEDLPSDTTNGEVYMVLLGEDEGE